MYSDVLILFNIWIHLNTSEYSTTVLYYSTLLQYSTTVLQYSTTVLYYSTLLQYYSTLAASLAAGLAACLAASLAAGLAACLAAGLAASHAGVSCWRPRGYRFVVPFCTPFSKTLWVSLLNLFFFFPFLFVFFFCLDLCKKVLPGAIINSGRSGFLVSQNQTEQTEQTEQRYKLNTRYN